MVAFSGATVGGATIGGATVGGATNCGGGAIGGGRTVGSAIGGLIRGWRRCPLLSTGSRSSTSTALDAAAACRRHGLLHGRRRRPLRRSAPLQSPLLDVLSLRSRDQGAPERQWGRSRWVDLRWPVPQGSMAHVGRIGDPAQRKWRALRASACRRAAYTFSRYTVHAGLGSRDLHQCVCLEEQITWVCVLS